MSWTGERGARCGANAGVAFCQIVGVIKPSTCDDNSARIGPKVRPECSKEHLLSLAPAEQKNFTIEPQSTADYTIQTFGQSDTLLVLFEDIAGEMRYVDGDDDSGTNRNARLHVRLREGRRYVLRVRLYLNYASGDTAVMMW